ncbi:hypothetical protein ACJ8BD_27205 [Klebsiella pneumoniae]
MFAQPTWLPGLGEKFAVLLEAASIEGALSMGGAISSGHCGDGGGVGRGVDQRENHQHGGLSLTPFALYRAGDAAGGQRALPGKKDKGAAKLWAFYKYFRIERSGDEGKARRARSKHFAPNGQ